MYHLFDPQAPQHYSGEINAGEAVEMNDVLSGRHEEIKQERNQIAFERRMLEQEREKIAQKTNELKMQLKAITDEILKLSQSTNKLGEETKIAVMQAPIEPGIYHLIFFEKLLEFLKSFRKKVDEAGIWLHACNKRASKRNAWGSNYKKHGAKYLLSGEHYLQRSAG